MEGKACSETWGASALGVHDSVEGALHSASILNQYNRVIGIRQVEETVFL